MYYGIYKNIRSSAWRCLVDFNIGSFPVDILKIARAVGIRVIKNSSVGDLLPGEHGKSYFNGQAWIIIYNDLEPVDVCRFTVAHELGHFFLGHDLAYSRYEGAQHFTRRPKAEEQADMFALRLLCPACIIKELDLHSAEDIAKYCLIPLSIAKARAERMKTVYKRDMFFTDPLEKQVYDNFCSYLKKAKKTKKI